MDHFTHHYHSSPNIFFLLGMGGNCFQSLQHQHPGSNPFHRQNVEVILHMIEEKPGS